MGTPGCCSRRMYTCQPCPRGVSACRTLRAEGLPPMNTEEMVERLRHWPSRLLNPEDQFFRGDLPDYDFNAIVGKCSTIDGGWDYFVRGFRDAADVLLESVIANPRRVPIDLLLYPLIFLYRHHFELLLKSIIIAGSKMKQSPLPPQKIHSLLDLWRQARPLIESCFPNDNWSQNNCAERLFVAFQHVDAASQTFRYPPIRGAEAPLFKHEHVNLRHFGDTATRLSQYLQQILFGLEHKYEQQIEWESEMAHWAP